MKKIISLVIALACVALLLVACSNKSSDQVDKDSAYLPTEIENVSIRIFDVSSSGATIILKDTNEEPFLYGEWYSVEKYDGGQWTEVEPIIENYGFTMIGYIPDENDEVKFEINWEWLYGKLPEGSYRLIKSVDNKYISVSFDITEAE